MYSVNGVSLDDDARGWGVLTSSAALLSIALDGEGIRVPSRDGIVSVPPVTPPPAGRLVVESPATNLEALLALVRSPSALLTVTAAPGRSVAFQCLEATPTAIDPNATKYEVEFILRFPAAFWRDANESTSAAAALDAAVVQVAVFAGLSAPVRDAIVRVKGSATGLIVSDAGGSWFQYLPNIPATSYLRFHSDTGDAFMTTTDTWTGGTNVTGSVDFGGPRGEFEITPAFTNPATRQGALWVTTTARSGASIQIRGKAAYLV